MTRKLSRASITVKQISSLDREMRDRNLELLRSITNRGTASDDTTLEGDGESLGAGKNTELVDV